MRRELRREARLVRSFSQRYLAYDVQSERQKLPMLPVRLIGEAARVKTIALVDSGATVTFIPPELAEAVALKVVERDVVAEGAGGKFQNNVCEFGIEVLKGTEVVARIHGTAHVPKDVGPVPYVVLGRDYLFRMYNITFREREERVVLRAAKRLRGSNVDDDGEAGLPRIVAAHPSVVLETPRERGP